MNSPEVKCNKESQPQEKPVYKCQKVARLTNNGYLNFLREFKKVCCNLSPQDTVRQGARAWNRLTCKQKAKFRQMYFDQKLKQTKKKKSGQSVRCPQPIHKGRRQERKYVRKAAEPIVVILPL